jgi:TRAP-type uncharacterized transport system fused permease subunit
MIMTGVLLVSVGLMVNVIATTGIGNTFSLMIADWAGGNLLIAIALIALASLVLGMGLPVTAAYIVLATLSAPALHIMLIRTTCWRRRWPMARAPSRAAHDASCWPIRASPLLAEPDADRRCACAGRQSAAGTCA